MLNANNRKTIIPEGEKGEQLIKYDKQIIEGITQEKKINFDNDEKDTAKKNNIIINNQTQKILVIRPFKQPEDNKSIKMTDFYEEIEFNSNLKDGIVGHIEKIAAKQKNFFSNFATKYCAGCVEDAIEDFKKGINDTYLDIVYEVAKRGDLSLNDNTFEQIIENLNTKLDQDPDNYSIVEIKNYIKEIVKDMPSVDNQQKITQGTLIGNTVSFTKRSYNIETKQVTTYNAQAEQTFQDQMNDCLGVYNGFSKKTDNPEMVNFNGLVIEQRDNNDYAINIGTHQYIITKDSIELLTKHIIDNWAQYNNPPLPDTFISSNDIKDNTIQNNNDDSIGNNSEGDLDNDNKNNLYSIYGLDKKSYNGQPLSQNPYIKEIINHILKEPNKHNLTEGGELKVDFTDQTHNNKYSLTIDLDNNLKIKSCIDNKKDFASERNGKQKNLNINNILSVISPTKNQELKGRFNISDQAELRLKTEYISDYSGKFFVRNPEKKARQLLNDISTSEQGNNDIFYFFSRNYKKLKELKGLNSNIEDRPIKSKIKTLFDKYKDDFTEDLSAIKTPFGLINADFINSFRTGQHALLGAITDCQKDKKNGYLLAATGMGKTKLLTETPGIIVDCSQEDENNFKNSTTNKVINITDDLPDIYEKIATACESCWQENSDNKEVTIKQILEKLEKNGKEYRFLLNIVPNLYKEVENPPVTIFTTNISKMDTEKFDSFTKNIGFLKELLVTLKIKSEDSEKAKVNTLIVLEEAHRILNDSEEKKKDAQTTEKIAKQEQIDALKSQMIIAAHNKNSDAFGKNLKELFKLDPNLVKKMLSDTIGTNTKSDILYDISEQITPSSNVNKLYNDFSKEIFGRNKKPLQNKKQKIEKELSNPQKIAQLQKEGLRLNVFCLSATLPPIEDLYKNEILDKSITKEFNPILPNVINTRPFEYIQLDNLDDVGNILTKTYSANNSFGSCSLILTKNEDKRKAVSALFSDMIEDKPLEKQVLITKESFNAMVRIFQYQMLEKANSLRETDSAEADSIIKKIQHIEHCVIESKEINSIYSNINDVLRIEKTEKPHSVQKLFRKSFLEKGKQTFINTAKINIISLILNKNINDTIKVTSPNIDSQKFYGDDIDMSKLGINDFNLNGFAEKVTNRTDNIADNVPGKNAIKDYYDLLSKIVAEAKKGEVNKEDILKKINNVFEDKEISRLISDKYENLLKLSITNDDPNILVHTGIGTICTQKIAGTGLSSGLINNVCSDTTLELESLQNLGRGDRGPYYGKCTFTSVNPDHAKSLGAKTSYKQGTHIIDSREKRRPPTPRAKLFEGRNSGGLQM